MELAYLQSHNATTDRTATKYWHDRSIL